MAKATTRRDFLKAAVGMTGAVVLAACAPSATPTPQPTKPSAPAAPPAAAPTAAAPAPAAAPTTAAAPTLKGAKVHLLRWSSFVPKEDAWFTEVVKKQWAEPNGVDLVVEFVAPNDVQPKVSVALESGTGPDIVMLMHNQAHLYDAKLLDVSAIVEKQGKDGGGLFDWCKAYLCPNGKWKAVPFHILANNIVYRTDWLKEIGESKFPDTFEELNRVGKLMKQKKSVPYGQAWGHSFSDPGSMAYPVMWAWGGQEVDESGKKVVINTPETVASVEFAVQWLKDSMSDEMLGWDDTANNRAYLAGQLWGTLNGSSIYIEALKNFPDVAKASDHATNPKGPKGFYHLGPVYSHAIPTYVKDPKPAEELLAWISAPPNYSTFMDYSGGYSSPPVKMFMDHPVWKKDPKLTIFRDVSFYRWPGYPGPASAASSEAQSKYIIVDMFAKAMKGDKPKDAVAWAEGELKRIYEKA